MEKLKLFVAFLLVGIIGFCIYSQREQKLHSCLKIIELDDEFGDFTFDQRTTYDSVKNKDYQLVLIEVKSLDYQHQSSGFPSVTSSYYAFNHLESLTDSSFSINDSRCMIYASPQSETVFGELEEGEVYLFAFKDKTVSSYTVTGGEFYISRYNTMKSYADQSDEVIEQVETARSLIEERVNKVYYFK